MENHHFQWGKSTISMVIFHSYVSHYQRVSAGLLHLISLGGTALLIRRFQASAPRTKEPALLTGKVRLAGKREHIKAWNSWNHGEASWFWIFQAYNLVILVSYKYGETRCVTTFCVCVRARGIFSGILQVWHFDTCLHTLQTTRKDMKTNNLGKQASGNLV